MARIVKKIKKYELGTYCDPVNNGDNSLDIVDVQKLLARYYFFFFFMSRGFII